MPGGRRLSPIRFLPEAPDHLYIARHDRRKHEHASPRGLPRRIPDLRTEVGDRAILRCLHFFLDNERVDRQLAALRDSDFPTYLDAVRSAGDSSWELLQNNYSTKNPREQGVPLSLAMSRLFLGEAAAVRIQGGGFAGTMQAYVPLEQANGYREFMEEVLGRGAVTAIRIRSIGTTEVLSSVLMG